MGSASIKNPGHFTRLRALSWQDEFIPSSREGESGEDSLPHLLPIQFSVGGMPKERAFVFASC